MTRPPQATVRTRRAGGNGRLPAAVRRPMFPLWLRLWHWTNAALFLVLAVTGLSLHFAGTGASPVPFRGAVTVHNAAGALLLVAYVGYLGALWRTGDWRQYLPEPRGLRAGLATQLRYYLDGIFRGAHHPFPATPERRFNPLQQLTYLVHMFLLFPLLVTTGVFMLFPGAAPDRVASLGGVWPMAVTHTALAYVFLAFLVVHVYLGLTAAEPRAGLRAMLTGGSAGPRAEPDATADAVEAAVRSEP